MRTGPVFCKCCHHDFEMCSKVEISPSLFNDHQDSNNPIPVSETGGVATRLFSQSDATCTILSVTTIERYLDMFQH